MAAILRLEDQRVLRDPAPAPPPIPLPAKGPRRAAVPPPPSPDLAHMLGDPDARVRRRAALAVGRVGLAEGVVPLSALLKDQEPEVRQTAAFALGLIGDRGALPALTAALGDGSILVQGRAAEALGMIGEPAAASAVGGIVARLARDPAVGGLGADVDDSSLDASAEAFRLSLYALVRLKAYDPIASAVLDSAGQPIIRWWPVAYALQRVEDPRALPALTALAQGEGRYTRAFAVKGLGAIGNARSVPILEQLADQVTRDPAVGVEAIRALGKIGAAAAAAGPTLVRVTADSALGPMIRAEAIAALGTIGPRGAVDPVLDLLADPSPAVRAASIRALAELDRETFVTVLSGLDPDRHWSVRAALASVLGTLDPQIGEPRLMAMLADSDLRVVPPVLSALVKLRSPHAEAVLLDRLKSDDVVVRMAAAANLGELKPADGPAALEAAYRLGERDSTYVARAAALAALAGYGAGAATDTLKTALADKDWAVRVRAAQLLNGLNPSEAARPLRPAPLSHSADAYESADLVSPSVSPHAYIDTDKGTVQIELSVLDAPLTVQNFVALARKGFFNGLSIHRVVPDFVVQDGDPRGDGEGGPGYTIRDELNEQPYLRGGVGMALDWKDTGGSQFFITHSPQPHLDARYTLFGHVVSGMDVVDRIDQWDVVRRVRIWDGTQMTVR